MTMHHLVVTFNSRKNMTISSAVLLLPLLILLPLLLLLLLRLLPLHLPSYYSPWAAPQPLCRELVHRSGIDRYSTVLVATTHPHGDIMGGITHTTHRIHRNEGVKVCLVLIVDLVGAAIITIPRHTTEACLILITTVAIAVGTTCDMTRACAHTILPLEGGTTTIPRGLAVIGRNLREDLIGPTHQ